MKSDFELLQRWASARDEAAFAEIVARHTGLVLGTARRRWSSQHLAEEVSQRVFTMLARKAGKLPQLASLGAWLHRATVLESTHLARREAIHTRKIAELTSDSAAMNTIDFPHEKPAFAADVDAALQQLSESDRQILMLRFYEGHSFTEIAKLLGKNADSAQKQSSRALERLAQKLRLPGVATVTAVGAFLSSDLSAKAAPVLIKSLSATAISQAGQISAWAAFTHTLQLMSYGKSTTVATCAILLSLGSFYGSYTLGAISYTKEAKLLVSASPIAGRLSGENISITKASSRDARRSVVKKSDRPLKDILSDISEIFQLDVQNRNMVISPNFGSEKTKIRMGSLAEFDPDRLDEALALLPEFRTQGDKYEGLAGFIFTFLGQKLQPRDVLGVTLKPEYAVDGKPPLFAMVMALEGWAKQHPADAWKWTKEANERGLFSLKNQNLTPENVMKTWIEKNPERAFAEIRQLDDTWNPYSQKILREALNGKSGDAPFKVLKTLADDRLALLVADSRPHVNDWTRDHLLPWLLDRPWKEVSMDRVLREWDEKHQSLLCDAIDKLSSPTANTVLTEYLTRSLAESRDFDPSSQEGQKTMNRLFKDPAVRTKMTTFITAHQKTKLSPQ